jgi:hypothetical protein
MLWPSNPGFRMREAEARPAGVYEGESVHRAARSMQVLWTGSTGPGKVGRRPEGEICARVVRQRASEQCAGAKRESM